MSVKERFVILCQYLLRERKCENEFVVLDCVLAVSEHLIVLSAGDQSLRHVAFDFVEVMIRLDSELPFSHGALNKKLVRWLENWWLNFG